MTNLTDEEVLAATQSDTPLNRARVVFSGEVGRIEQQIQTRYNPTPIEWRRMEFEAVERIIGAYNNSKDN